MADNVLEVDQNRLDFEWIRQPRLYRKYARRKADAQLEVNHAKDRLAVVEAELQFRIREEPAEFNLPKVTEKSVEMAVKADKEYREALREVHEAEHKVNLLQAMVTALDHKKKALEKLVDLFLAGYFATPRAKGDAKEVMDEQRKRSVRRGLQDANDDD